MGRTDGFSELTLEAHDLEVMEGFYAGVVGLAVLTREDDRIWLDVGGHARLGLWSPGRKEFGDRGGAHVHFAFRATPGGLDELCDALRSAGTDVRGPEAHPGGDRSIYFEDPEGNVVETWDFFGRGGDSEELADDTGDGS